MNNKNWLPGPGSCLLVRNDLIPCLLGSFPAVHSFDAMFKWKTAPWEGWQCLLRPPTPTPTCSSGFRPSPSGSWSGHSLLPWESCRFPACLQTWFFPKTFWYDSLWSGECSAACFIIILHIVFIESRLLSYLAMRAGPWSL